MSTLDRAFIKAYTKRSLPPKTASDPNATTPKPHVSFPAPTAPEPVAEDDRLVESSTSAVQPPPTAEMQRTVDPTHGEQLPAVTHERSNPPRFRVDAGEPQLRKPHFELTAHFAITTTGPVAEPFVDVDAGAVDVGVASDSDSATDVAIDAENVEQVHDAREVAPAREQLGNDERPDSTHDGIPIPSIAPGTALEGHPTSSLAPGTALEGRPTPAEDATERHDVQSPVAEAEMPTTTEPTIRPAWEVDHFLWPASCERLLNEQADALREAGQRLLDLIHSGKKMIAIAGIERGHGCTTVAICLARQVAKSTARSALIDAHVAAHSSDRSLAKQLGVTAPCGWQQAARGETPWSEVMVASIRDGLTLLPLDSTGSSAPTHAAEHEPSGALRQIGAGFEVLIADVGPVDQWQPDAVSPSSVRPWDAVVLVRDARSDTRAKIAAEYARLCGLGLQDVFVVENFSEPDQPAA